MTTTGSSTTGRTAKGTFAPGHRLSANLKRSTGQKVGRPKTIAGEVRSALQIAEDAMPELIRTMLSRSKGIEPDGTPVPVAVRQQATEYLCNRIYGKPNQPLSNKDGTPLRSFAFTLPVGFTPTPGGLFAGSDARINNDN